MGILSVDVLSVLDCAEEELSAAEAGSLEDELELSSLDELSSLLSTLITDGFDGSSVFVLQPQSRIAAKIRAATHFFIITPYTM